MHRFTQDGAVDWNTVSPGLYDQVLVDMATNGDSVSGLTESSRKMALRRIGWRLI